MADTPLAYQAPASPAPGITIVVEDDVVTLTKTPPRGLVLGTLIVMTLVYTGLWVMLGRVVFKLVNLGMTFAGMEFAWRFVLSMALHVIPALGWSVVTVIGWVRYYRYGNIPFTLQVTRKGAWVSERGVLRPVATRRWSPDAVQCIEMRVIKHALSRKPIDEIVIRVRWRVPIQVRLPGALTESARAFVERANHLLNLRT